MDKWVTDYDNTVRDAYEINCEYIEHKIPFLVSNVNILDTTVLRLCLKSSQSTRRVVSIPTILTHARTPNYLVLSSTCSTPP